MSQPISVDVPHNLGAAEAKWRVQANLHRLDGKLPAGYELLLVSEESYTTFDPMLPEAVGASVFPEQVVAPIRQMIKHARFMMGRVTSIDTARKAFSCETLAGTVEQPYEHVLLAFGNRARLDLLPGLAATGPGMMGMGGPGMWHSQQRR